MRYVLLILVYVALTAYSLADVVQTPERAPRGVHKGVWVAIILLFPFLGAGVWIFLKYFKPRGEEERLRGPLAPDDDPEYLTWLREQRRRRRQNGT